MKFWRGFRRRYEEARDRDMEWIMKMDVQLLNRRLLQLLMPYLILNFVDVLSTLVGLNSTSAFTELNPIAAALFGLQFGGFIFALLLKYLPAVILTYVTFMKATTGNPLTKRLLKFSCLIVLCAADVFYVYVVGSNLGNLLRIFL